MLKWMIVEAMAVAFVFGNHAGTARAEAGKDIVDTAVSAGSFNTLATALKAADLVDALKGPGPFTVFAPTDEAFAKLPKGVLDNLLKNKEQLRAVLMLHVVSGCAKSGEVVKLTSAKTLLGQSLPIDTSKGVRIGSATVTKTDIGCTNGVIHVIDAVLLPKNDIIETARNAGSFKTLLAAIEAAGLTDTLRSEGPFTVFAPTDDAFAALPKGALENLLKDKKKLTSVLTYHVVPGKVMAKDVVKLKEAKTVQGQNVKIDASSGVKVDDARVIKPDVAAENGVIHVIDAVILPQ